MKKIIKTKDYRKNMKKFQNFDNRIYKILETYFINLKQLKVKRIKERKIIKVLIKNEFNVWLKNKIKSNRIFIQKSLW